MFQHRCYNYVAVLFAIALTIFVTKVQVNAFHVGSIPRGSSISSNQQHKVDSLSLRRQLFFLDPTSTSSSTSLKSEGESSTPTRSPLLTLMDEETDYDPIQMGFWVPNRIWATANFLLPLRDLIQARKEAGTLTPMTDTVAYFKDFITSNSIYRMYVNGMITESNLFLANASEKVRKEIDKDGDNDKVLSYDFLFDAINDIVTTSPSFNTGAMVGTPMNALLALCMGTGNGTALFHDSEFNQEMKKVLDSWNTYLKTPASLDKLDIDHPEKTGSWISKAAFHAGVWENMTYDETQQGYGFNSWNDFFTREFEKGARNFTGTPSQICLGCETTPYQYANNLKDVTDFWVKSMPYSLLDIFGGQKELAKIFAGGQAYQGFLSATKYHRWRCPLDGELLASWVEPGTYFAQRPGQGEVAGTFEGTLSQPYLGHVATRAIFIFNSPDCGLVAMICIGMVEVSTCYIEPSKRLPLNLSVLLPPPSITVKKGDPLGKFEFGGSTHMLLFQKDSVILEEFARNASMNRNFKAPPIKMGTVVASPIKGGPPLSEISSSVRIIAALINPEGNDKGLEIVTIINVSPRSINLDKWTIAGNNGNVFELNNVTVQGGDLQRITLPKYTAQLTNHIDGIIELKDKSGNLVHSVSYESGQTKEPGNTIVF